MRRAAHPKPEAPAKGLDRFEWRREGPGQYVVWDTWGLGSDNEYRGQGAKRRAFEKCERLNGREPDAGLARIKAAISGAVNPRRLPTMAQTMAQARPALILCSGSHGRPRSTRPLPGLGKPAGICPGCGREALLTAGGRIAPHRVRAAGDLRPAPGSRRPGRVS